MTRTIDFKIVEEVVNNTGNAIAFVLDQLVKGSWTDDLGHPVKNNAAMLDLSDQLKALIVFRNEHLGYDFPAIAEAMMKGPTQ